MGAIDVFTKGVVVMVSLSVDEDDVVLVDVEVLLVVVVVVVVDVVDVVVVVVEVVDVVDVDVVEVVVVPAVVGVEVELGSNGTYAITCTQWLVSTPASRVLPSVRLVALVKLSS